MAAGRPAGVCLQGVGPGVVGEVHAGERGPVARRTRGVREAARRHRDLRASVRQRHGLAVPVHQQRTARADPRQHRRQAPARDAPPAGQL